MSPEGHAASPSEQGALLHIGDAAARAELSVRTVRAYEEAGLVRPSARTNGGFRLYSEHDVDRLVEVRRMKGLALSLGELGELLGLLKRSEAPELLQQAEVTFVVDSLYRYRERADRGIERLEQALADARELHRRVVQQLATVER
ncbi:MAG TPA: MerR family transcriptional regulator [Gaiellaceae bacterium]|nr:MerR family transcriptional regulator [Gaiellaceae bacterium]